jgi:hypothetical protein
MVGIGLILTGTIPVSAGTEAAYQCICRGVERNGDRKADLNMTLDSEGNLLTGKMSIISVCQAKSTAPGGTYSYSGGAKINRNIDQYEWVVDANWAGDTQNCDKSLTKAQGSFLVRKFKIQNVAELQMKSKDFTTWYVFPHGCDCKSPESNTP